LSKEIVSQENLVETVVSLLDEIQENIFKKALNFRNELINEVNNFDEFKEVLENKGGFISAHWDGTSETEDKIKNMTKATIRCIPLNAVDEEGLCVLTGAKSPRRVLFAKAY